MDEFVLRFQSFEGIAEILGTMDIESIVSMVSVLSGIAAEDLKEIKIKSLGADDRRSSYVSGIKELKKTIPFFSELYRVLSDENSKRILTGVFKYWLIPDEAFLKEGYCEASEDGNYSLVIRDTEEIKDHIEEIKALDIGEIIKIKIGSALDELYLYYKLINFVRQGLCFDLNMADEDTISLYVFRTPSKMEKLLKKKKIIRLVSLAKDPGAWRNEELLKDKGLIPYLLYRDQGYESVMVGKDCGSYPYLVDYLKGMKMEFLPDGSEEKKKEWILSNAEDTDILILNGLYPVNMDILKIYREKNPEGLVYLPLDANSAWMDRMIHKDQGFQKLMEQVDLIGSSGRRMQRHLNKKWPWAVEYFPNGYFHPWIKIDHIEYSKKENLILTVGRLGTEQKATDVMMEAFAVASEDIRGWKLKLIGGIEPSFNDYLESFFIKHPELKDRILFVGKITDKKALFEEYEKAKIFSLTSILEGGTPNVVAEALHSGCAMAVTEFDAYNDAIAEGKCGMSAPIGNVEKMASVYRSLCSNEKRLKEMCEYAFMYSEMYFSMEKVAARINESLRSGI